MNKNNIIQFIKISFFAMILLFVMIVLNFIMKPYSVDLDNIAGFYGEKENSLDMVYIGGSACFVYWEPLKAWEDSGIASYNFSADTIQPELYKYMVQETLKNQKPNVIVLDARAFQYRDIDQRPSEVAYRNVLTGTPFSLERFNFIEENVPKYLHENTLSYHFDLIKYHGAVRNNSISNSINIMLSTYQNKTKGFFFVPKVAKMQKHDFNTDKVTPMKSGTNDILDELLNYLKTTDTKVLFVVSPYSETKSHKENFNYIEEKVIEAGFDFLDTNEYYDVMNIDFDNDFYNINHVNIYGADKYTEYLEKYINDKYSIQDRRDDEKYSENWNSLLDSWHNQVNETKTAIDAINESE